MLANRHCSYFQGLDIDFNRFLHFEFNISDHFKESIKILHENGG